MLAHVEELKVPLPGQLAWTQPDTFELTEVELGPLPGHHPARGAHGH